MKFSDLQEIRELLKHQHVVAAVVCLGNRPMRYGELGSAMSGWIGSRISDGEITRTLHRLEERGLVEDAHSAGPRLLTLTPKGRSYLTTVSALVKALRT
ncbi:hypothetical protein O7627_27465 [Solwaraspora sp. WMMD1047]|uniref:hypothetical protein n=1 Tax=Solwaraspora sp. WMMD1047 TaxID=3016102 RepID=UPI0024180B15|nr:hypothetical protein [Solwaraspora sp. WMMD1047]MDG4833016.1 hypothetical protein [Solwaraspora sp. WMMD1047]